jgi:ATP adenylyltransferase/5',5'''-P-1,P-4-tetraphosphate phosphorylase II
MNVKSKQKLGMNDLSNFSSEAMQLIQDQKGEWNLAGKNYESLKKVKVKSFAFDNFKIDVQFNPERIISSSAKVDSQSIEKRPCFLCLKNLPPQQRGIAFDGEYNVLVNPFPIFPKHLTIPNFNHTNQRIKGNFGSMLDLSKGLNEFTIFYNGPKCGASAPDHLHFQAGIKGFLPIEKEFKEGRCSQIVKQTGNVSILNWNEYLRGVITLQSKSRNDLVEVFDQIYSKLEILNHSEEEPMLNILSTYDDKEWIVHVFPRILHRPQQYFESGEKQILLSPASVDMGGVLITPREEDFNKITREDVRDIFRQVCMDPVIVREVIGRING